MTRSFNSIEQCLPKAEECGVVLGLKNPYDLLEELAPDTFLRQAKAFCGGGKWYTLDLDYPRIGDIMRRHNYKGCISVEFEGNADPLEAVPKILEVMREVFYYELK